MSNHTVDCDVCGEDLRGLSGGHAPGCPGPNAPPDAIRAYKMVNMDFSTLELRTLAHLCDPVPASALTHDEWIAALFEGTPPASPISELGRELAEATRAYLSCDTSEPTPALFEAYNKMQAVSRKLEAEKDWVFSDPMHSPHIEGGCHPTHKTRASDAGSFDEVCINCGHTDHIGGWGKLALPCPNPDGEGEYA